MIEFFNEDTNFPDISIKIVTKWISAIIKRKCFSVSDITFIFCSDEYILHINKQFLNHDYFTDIITFNYNENKLISGDIFISTDTVLSNTKRFDTAFENELHRVIIHGILHLLGYDDQTDDQQVEMTKHEDEALKLLSL
ncbi:MAG: rRNA maturation RNase YbeY [Prolixibacteraceae bacterium]|jgi:probable rRNA maturation factor|nr:rRNA maturation RNase YbeY [Prolixibacteraceae bacterium]